MAGSEIKKKNYLDVLYYVVMAIVAGELAE